MLAIWRLSFLWCLELGVWCFPRGVITAAKTFTSPSIRDRVAAMIHVGIGYDVHRLVEGRKLILGGVDLHHAKGLDGHSDADVVLHAVCDSVLGALGEGDIGHFFPDTDPRWKNAPSKVFLQEVARQVSFHNGKI